MKMRPSVTQLRDTSRQALLRAGAPERHADIQVDLLIEAELRGHPSHGLLRLPRLVERIRNRVADPAAEGAFDWRGEGLLSVDGQAGLGPVVALKALDALYGRVSRLGVAAAAIRNSNHLGMLAWYAEKIARDGLVGIVMTTSEALVHPYGGRQALLGTNPIAIGVPASPAPFVLDMATSLVSMGKIHDHANRGAEIPLGWALDEEGRPTTDPVAAKSGALAPFGDAKGYALGLAFQVLVTSLAGSATGRDVRGTLDSTEICNKGDLIIVLQPASGAARQISAYLDAVRTSPPADPARPVVVPGDRARATRETRLAEGIDLAPPVWAQIEAFAKADPFEPKSVM